MCCDCSGLISSYTGIQRNSAHYYDLATERATISQLKANWQKYVGWGIWMRGHIGIVSDTEGYYYAMDGSDRNAAHLPIEMWDWKYVIKLSDINYGSGEFTVNQNPTLNPAKSDINKGDRVASRHISGFAGTYASHWLIPHIINRREATGSEEPPATTMRNCLR